MQDLRSFQFCVSLGYFIARLASAANDAGGWSEPKRNNEGKVVQELKIEAPSFTEEDQYGYVMPDRYRCDSCRAVLFHLEAGLKKTHPKSRKMKQWEYTEVFDDVCKNAFSGYGVKLLNGENTLSGPGLKHNEDSISPGAGAIQMGGDSWGKRLGEICREIVYEKVGEEEMYEMLYIRDRVEDKTDDFAEKLCRGELKQCQWKPTAKSESASDNKADSKAKAKAKEDKAAKNKAKAEKKKADAEKKAAADKATEKRVKEAEAKEKAAKASKASSSTSEVVDVQTFLRNLAVRHGLTSDEYLSSRTVGEWERLTVAMAGRIFNKLATSEPDESCRAGAFGAN